MAKKVQTSKVCAFFCTFVLTRKIVLLKSPLTIQLTLGIIKKLNPKHMNSSEIDKIVSYLNQYKNQLSEYYNWNVNTDKLVELKVFSKSELEKVKSENPFEKEIILKKRICLKLNDFLNNSKTDFNNLSLWIIKNWGGINSPNDAKTLKLIDNYLNNGIIKFERIASLSKVLAYLKPKEFIIYDSRVAYSLNWILLTSGIKSKFFPIPEGRNSKMIAFDMNVLIRMNDISSYKVNNEKEFKNRLFISKIDKKVFLPKNDAYFELNKTISQISKKLWNNEKSEYLYYTEMLLFAIADTEIYKDITNGISLTFKTKTQENPIYYENENQKVIADWNAVIQLKNINYDNKSICEHLSISEMELKKLEKEYNRLINSKK